MKTSFENFKDDISVLEDKPNLWKGNLSDRWSIGSTPNGGYSMAFAAKAISNSLVHKDPLSISANYAGRLDFGETLVKVYPIHVTKSTSTARAELIQQDANSLLGWFDWLPVRLWALVCALAGSFSPNICLYFFVCFRT